MTTITVHRPDIEDPPIEPVTLAPRGEVPAGARLLLVDNGKAKARDLLMHLARELQRRLPIETVTVHSKPGAGYVIEDEQVAELADEVDLVVTGLGDCGACSACSLQDALIFERAGVPATVLITEVFVANIARFAEALGSPGYHSLVVPHPAATKSDEQLQVFASAISDAAAEQLGARAPAAVG